VVQEVLDEWDSFLWKPLVDGVNRYHLYHSSFRDFLYRHDIIQAAGVDLQDIHGMIGGRLFDDLFDG